MDKQKTKRRPNKSTAALVLAILQNDQRPHRAYELMERLRGNGVSAPTTIYRALDQLISAGSVHRLASLNAYVACRGGQCRENAGAVFAICEDCGDVEEISDTSVATAAVAWAKTSTFSINAMTFELRGTCRTCGNSANNDARD